MAKMAKYGQKLLKRAKMAKGKGQGKASGVNPLGLLRGKRGESKR